MFPSDLGNNRLKSGFRGRNAQHGDSPTGTPSESDDQEADGGITLNVAEQGDYGSPIVISDDEQTDQNEENHSDESELEEGEEREVDSTTQNRDHMDAVESIQDEQVDVSFVIDPSPSTKPLVCLKDLTAIQLESQIKYAFWQFSRDEIDLAHPAKCLHCLGEGHIDEVCPQKTCIYCHEFNQHNSNLCPSVKRCQRCRQPGHVTCQDMKNTTIPCDICSLPGHTEDGCPMKYYTSRKTPNEGLHLWISCCACASKSHLVGDCQEASLAAPQWSLRALDPNKITNLNLQTGIEKREKEAEQRSMRPEGMRIRGRATRHNADPGRRDSNDSDDDLENFFSHPPLGRRNLSDTHHSDQRRSRDGPRYDRYEAPSDTYRPPRNAFYATDSFGRPRSRSPPRYGGGFRARPRSVSQSSSDSYRPANDYDTGRRSPSSLRGQPLKRQKYQNTPRQQPPQQPSSGPSKGFQIQLPSRKGSNPNLQNPSSANLPPKPPGQPGSAKNSNKSKKAPTAPLSNNSNQGPNQNRNQDAAGPRKKVKNKNRKTKRTV